jgi:myo-inositol 2-dehydrogenase/D-chiro-inositol 1-dehydrogenase
MDEKLYLPAGTASDDHFSLVVTPERAGWAYSGLRVLELAPGQAHTWVTGGDESVPADWRERFGRAFDAEFTDWLRAVGVGTVTGPGSWDGYAAALVADQSLRALSTGGRVAVDMPERPDFYAKAHE